MGSTAGVLVFVIIIVAVYFLWRSKRINLGKLGKWFSGGSGNNEAKITRYEAEMSKELGENENLRRVLAAKKDLLKARAANVKLRKDIDEINEENVDRKELPPALIIKPRR